MTEILHHPCVAGLLTDSMIQVIGREGNDWIANVDFVLAEGSPRAVRIYGQIWLMDARNYDMVAFALLRELFGFGFPQMIIVKYMGNFGLPNPYGHLHSLGTKMIVTRRLPDRELRESDYSPISPGNFQFRFQLCILIYFCKFVGCSISLRDIRVMNGVPFIWRCNSLGLKRAATITKEEFAFLFGVTPKVAHTIFHSVDHAIIDSGRKSTSSGIPSDLPLFVPNPADNLHPNPPNNLHPNPPSNRDDVPPITPGKKSARVVSPLEGPPTVVKVPGILVGFLPPDKKSKLAELAFSDTESKLNEHFKAVGLDVTEEPEEVEEPIIPIKDVELPIKVDSLNRKQLEELPDSRLFSVETPNIEYSDLQGTMFQLVVDYFRKVNFDKDYVRECLFIRENAVRMSKGNKHSFYLSKPARDIAALMEENYVHLTSAYPFRIF